MGVEIAKAGQACQIACVSFAILFSLPWNFRAPRNSVLCVNDSDALNIFEFLLLRGEIIIVTSCRKRCCHSIVVVIVTDLARR